MLSHKPAPISLDTYVGLVHQELDDIGKRMNERGALQASTVLLGRS